MSPPALRVFRFSTSRRRQPVRIVGLRHHLIGAAEQVEVVDVGRAHVDRQRVEHARDRHPQQLRLGAVDIGVDLRRMRVEEGEGLGEARGLRRRAGNDPGRAAPARASRARRGPATYPFSPPPVPMPGTEGGSSTKAKASSIGASCWRRSARMRGAVRPRDARSSNGLQRHEDHAGVGRVGEGRAVEAGEGDGVLHARALQNDLGRLRGSPRRCASSEAPGGSWNAAIR